MANHSRRLFDIRAIHGCFLVLALLLPASMASSTARAKSSDGPAAGCAVSFGSFRSFDAGFSPISVASGDFNGDGHKDLATANYGSNDVSILMGNGDATFNAAINYEVGINPTSIATGDYDGDGNADLAVANFSSNDVSILLSKGDGTFQSPVKYDVSGGPVSVV